MEAKAAENMWPPSAVDENQVASNPIHVTADIRRQVEDNLPDAARLRAQTTLVGSEWFVPVVPWQYLGKDNGIAVVPKQFLYHKSLHKWDLPGRVLQLF